MFTENEIMNQMLALKKDSKYRNERFPVSKFCENAGKYIGIKITDCIKNEDDPPDYFLVVNGKEIDFEVTSFTSNEFFENNKYWDDIYDIADEIIKENKDLLKPGNYSIRIFPVTKNKFKPELSEKIPILFRKINNQNKCQIIIHNLKKQKNGKIELIRISNSKHVEIDLGFMIDSELFNSEKWDILAFKKYLQECIDNKEKRYQKYSSKFRLSKNEKWLLLADMNFEMNTHNIGFDFSSVSIKSDFFDRIFFN